MNGVDFSAPAPVGIDGYFDVTLDSWSRLLLVSAQSDHTIGFVMSTDGISFSPPVQVTFSQNGSRHSFPKVASDLSGTIHVIYFDEGDLHIYYTRSVDGVSFSAPGRCRGGRRRWEPS